MSAVPEARPGDPLTRFELRFAVLRADTNLSDAVMARRLQISPNAVQTCKRIVNVKLRVRSRQELRSRLLECELAAVVA